MEQYSWNGINYQIDNNTVYICNTTSHFEEMRISDVAPDIEYAKISYQVPIIDCHGLFADCHNLIEADLTGLDTTACYDFAEMFSNCENLEKVDGFSELDFHNASTMERMFANCISLIDANLENCTIGKTINRTEDVFLNCPSWASWADDDPGYTTWMEGQIEALRSSNLIREKDLGHGISSFNFTREAFTSAAWDEQTTQARGLFIDVIHKRVHARSYEKFFNIGERPDTQFDVLLDELEYPLQAYVKENGYLGICSSNGDGTLFCASKSTNEGPFAETFNELLHATLGNSVEDFSNYLWNNNLSAVFEVIDIINDRHIIEYQRSGVVLLDLIYNDIRFERLQYNELVTIANRYGFQVKIHACEISSPADFQQWYDEVSIEGYQFDEHYIEGFVIADANETMVKFKCGYYRYWKDMRAIIEGLWRRGHSKRLQRVLDEYPEAEDLYTWLVDYLDWLKEEQGEDSQPPHVMDVRKAWVELGGQDC